MDLIQRAESNELENCCALKFLTEICGINQMYDFEQLTKKLILIMPPC